VIGGGSGGGNNVDATNDNTLVVAVGTEDGDGDDDETLDVAIGRFDFRSLSPSKKWRKTFFYPHPKA
jgi:hypothetical protein